MIVTHSMTMDLTGQAQMPQAEMMAGDQFTRQLELSLYCGEEPWTIPEDAHAVVCFLKSDGTGGEYDSVGDGEPACRFSENVLTVRIAPQVLTAAGPVMLTVELMRGNCKISTFAILLSVRNTVPQNLEAGDILQLNGFLRIPDTAEAGQYFRVAAVDEHGAVTRVEAVNLDVADAVEDALMQALEGGEFQGASAYEIAVANGFEGTQEEWLESLQAGFPDSAELGDIQQINVTGSLTTDASVVVDFHGSRVQGVEAPVQDTDAATKGYADQAARNAAADYLVPEDWQEAVDAAVQTVTANQDAGGRNCVTFAYFSDCHMLPGGASGIGHLAAAVMDLCAIPFALMCGDAAASDADSETSLRDSLKEADAMLKPIRWERLLQALGEADGAFNGGQPDAKAIYGAVFRKLSSDTRRVYGGDGSYYYLDYPAARVRFIVLNSAWVQDGSAMRSENFGYGNEQLNWLASEALSFGETGWSVVLAAHVPSVSGWEASIRDDAVLQGILLAHHWGRSYSGTSGTAGQWDYVAVTCDYSGQETARIIGFFSGHTHQDGIVTDELPYVAVTIADSAQAPVLDFVTVNLETQSVFLTRLGEGRNRAYGYGDIPYLLYHVASLLTGCTTSNDTAWMEEQGYYHTELTPADGCSLSSVTVTMGGEDITDQCYAGGVIDIYEVTGDIVVTAVAEG